jgi:hypothetical protein
MTSVPSTTSIQTGARVITADGKQLGVVKEVRADRFKIDVRWAPDYWLGPEVVDNVGDDLIQLFITKEGVGAAKLHDVDKIDGSGLPSAQ